MSQCLLPASDTLPGAGSAGYGGDIEVEMLNADVRSADPDAVVGTLIRRYVQHVLVA